MDTSKIQITRDWPTPQKGKDVQLYLGFADFYRRFIASYSDITAPLTRLTHKDAPWVLSPQYGPFNSSNRLSSAHILHDFDLSLPPVVGTDASDYTTAGILSVRTKDGQVHPLAFFTRTLSGAELNYDTHNKELLAIFEAFKTWRHYLASRHHRIDVITDHKNPEYFSSTEIPMRRQASWSGFHSDMAIRLRPGTLCEKPDSHTWRVDFYLTRGGVGSIH